MICSSCGSLIVEGEEHRCLDARGCESKHRGHERVSTSHVALPDGTFNRACSVGAELSQVLAREALAQRLGACKVGGPHHFEVEWPEDMQLMGRARRWAYRCQECGQVSDREVPVEQRRYP